MAKNLIDVVIPQEVVTQVQGRVNELRELLTPYLVTLTKEERASLPKISDKTMPFVSKTVEYVGTNPKLIPPMMEAPEMIKDFERHQALQPIFNLIDQLADNISDTMMISGHEAYVQALLYYSSVKLAAKQGDPDAKSIQEDLGKRFVVKSKRKPEE